MKVQKFYNDLPYPLHPRPTDWAEPLRAMCSFTPARILHAGCATGSQTRSLAYVFPDSEIVGLDFADSSLALARKWLTDPKMKNVTFEKADLTESLDRFGKFDMVLSYGVLHHIPAIDKAVANIRNVLNSDQSPFFIFLYGKYGRARLSHLQEALALWQSAVSDVSDEDRFDALWEVSKLNGTFSGPRGWLKYALVKTVPYWRNAWLSSNADAYLHPHVRYYDMGDILNLCERHGLVFHDFVRRTSTMSISYPKADQKVFEKFRIKGIEHLSPRERYAIIDRLVAPQEYEFVCHRRDL